MATEEQSTEERIQQIKKAIKTTNNKTLFIKYRAIQLNMEGKPVAEISQAIGKATSTINSYLKQYRENGIEGLQRKPGSGKKPRLNDEQRSELKKLITTSTPDDNGFPPDKNWTCSIIATLIFKKYTVAMSVSGVCEMLKRMNMSYTRPTYCLAKANPEKQEEFKKKLFRQYWSGLPTMKLIWFCLKTNHRYGTIRQYTIRGITRAVRKSYRLTAGTKARNCLA